MVINIDKKLMKHTGRTVDNKIQLIDCVVYFKGDSMNGTTTKLYLQPHIRDLRTLKKMKTFKQICIENRKTFSLKYQSIDP